MPTDTIPIGSYEAREWLAEVLRRAVDCAEAIPAMHRHEPGGLAPYVLGYLIAAAQLTEAEQDQLMARCLQP